MRYIKKRRRMADLDRIISGDLYPWESYTPQEIIDFTIERDEILNVYFDGIDYP